MSAAWASVHAPAEASRAWTWLLERGFSGLVAGPAPRQVDWGGLARAMRDLPVSVLATRADSALQPLAAGEASLASRSSGERGSAADRISAAVRLAAQLGCRRVILDPGPVRVAGDVPHDDLGDAGAAWNRDTAAALLARRNVARDAGLDSVCRTLFELLRQHDDMEFCLTPSRSLLGLGEPEALTYVFADLGNARLRYWHDAALAARRAELLDSEQGAWLEAFANNMSGMTLGDVSGVDLYLPPGAGGVDYPLLAAYRRRFGRPIPTVVELDLAVEPSEIPGVHALLDKYGL